MKRKLIALTTIFTLMVPITLPQTAYAGTSFVQSEKVQYDNQMTIIDRQLELVDMFDDIAVEWFNRDYIDVNILDTITMSDGDIRNWSNKIKNDLIKTKKPISKVKFDIYTKAITKYNGNIQQLMDIFRELD